MVRWLRAGLVGLGLLLAVVSLIPTGFAFLALTENTGTSTVRIYGYRNTPDGPHLQVIALAGWLGLCVAGAALLAVPAAAAIATIRGPSPLARRLALVGLAAWLAWWMIGFARMVATFGAAADHTHIIGLALTALGVLGLVWAALRPTPSTPAAKKTVRH